VKRHIKKHMTYRNAGILGWVGLALIIASFFLPAAGWQDNAVSALGFVLTIVSLAATYHERGYIKGITEHRFYFVECTSTDEFTTHGEPSCPTRIMDGRNELRCWFPAGHDGECK